MAADPPSQQPSPVVSRPAGSLESAQSVISPTQSVPSYSHAFTTASFPAIHSPSQANSASSSRNQDNGPYVTNVPVSHPSSSVGSSPHLNPALQMHHSPQMNHAFPMTNTESNGLERTLPRSPFPPPGTLSAHPSQPPRPVSPVVTQPSTTSHRPSSPVAPLPPPQYSQSRPAVSVPVPAPATPEPRASNAIAANGYRPLNVKDALTYLDQVKIQFSDQPEVYNKFLDIMKDFKSQAIDTPGVIERVSGLFKGHPSLISGFNTFLPPGYRIECSTDECSRDVIKVTTPSGVTSTMDGEPLKLISETAPSPRNYQHPPSYGPSSATYGRGPNTAGVMASTSNYPHPSPQTASPGQAEEGQGRRPPVEFNHAINYVNKIKNRFAGDPDTYKQFLEILQMYQKDQKPIQEVYTQVQVLFDGANDLLDEFKQFLPDASGNHSVGSAALFGAGGRMPYGGKKAMGLSSAGQGRKKRVGPVSGAGIPKRSKLHHKMVLQTSDVRSGVPPDEEIVRPVISAEEVEFFERVRKYIGNKSTYNAFLKLLSLFSQQIVDQNLLVSRVETFIGGNKELFDWFKTLVGYDGKDEVIENVPADKTKPDLAHCKTCGPSYRLVPKTVGTKGDQSKLSVDSKWQNQTCSGRDALCWEVLNDEYVSHPTWASEDNGFVASKKNQYEEALNRVEEERYDYDLNIEANLNTIGLLEPIAKKIANMSPEEKAEYRILPGLGGSSQTIYQRILKKIYGSDRGLEIIELLHDNPARTVPIVLKRLKQKDDEWKRAQREWNKIWREVEAKNYWKSLDYQGITFKSSDRKAITAKALVAEIESLRKDQRQGKTLHSDSTRVLMTGRQGPQIACTFKDKTLFKDISRLVFSFLERQSIYNAAECDQVRAFIETFVPLFFDVTDVVPDAADIEEEDEGMEDVEDEEDESRSMQSYDSDGDVVMNTRRTALRRTRTANRAMPRLQNNEDERLLKDVLTRNMIRPPHQTPEEIGDEDEEDTEQEDKDDTGTEVDVQLSSGDEASPVILTAPHRKNSLVQEDFNMQAADIDSISPERRTVFNFFGNDSFYCFFRLLQMAYGRLEKLKAEDAEYKLNPGKEEDTNKIALELDTINRRMSVDKMGLNRGHYHALLNLIDKFFEENIDQQQFEESARYIFGTKAYVIFTIDKLILTLIRHIHDIVTRDSCQSLISLFEKEREVENPDSQSIKIYRLLAEDAVGAEDNLYNIVFDTSNRILSIQLLGQDDPTYHEAGEQDGYEEYVASYIDWTKETDGVQQTDLEPRFLKRNLRHKPKDKDLSGIHVHSRMQYKICRNTYHLFYIIGTEDTFVRCRPSPPTPTPSKFAAWLESDKGWGRDVQNKEEAEAAVRNTLFGKQGKKDVQPKSEEHH
ncbi:hypothetical protein CLU79DRAFT_767523 [Phycomyces nitens]|nr:hypothetical protein CLU79DRAFT_767523 [Phycomyces nitens]